MNAQTIAVPGLEFFEDGHRYVYRGLPLVSVTKVIRAGGLGPDYSTVPPAVLAAAAARGRAVHAMVHYDCEGTLDENTIDPAIAPYLQTWRRFLRESRYMPMLLETRVVHRGLRYAGCLDGGGLELSRTGAEWPVLMDLKTGEDEGAGEQTMAYAVALWKLLEDEAHGFNEFPFQLYRALNRAKMINRWTVKFIDEGRNYRLIQHRDPRGDFNRFREALERLNKPQERTAV